MNDENEGITAGHDATDRSALDSAVVSALATERNRIVLEILRERRAPIPVHDLATEVAAREAGTPLLSVTEDQHERTAATLHHQHLPELAALDLIERDGDAVAAGRLPEAVDARTLTAEGSDVVWRTLDVVAGNERRELAVSVLADADGPRSLEDLARAVDARREDDGRGNPEGDDSVDRTAALLYSVDLPKLAEVGLVDYDRAERTVEYGGPATLAAAHADRSTGGDAGADDPSGERPGHFADD